MKEITIDGVTYSLTPKEEIKQETKLPKTWEELEDIEGYFVKSSSVVSNFSTCDAVLRNKNIFATKEQAEASIALAQLSQLLKVYRGGWLPDWKDDNYKYAIQFSQDVLEISSLVCSNAFITLPTKELAKEFLNNFSELILKAKPLL